MSSASLRRPIPGDRGLLSWSTLTRTCGILALLGAGSAAFANLIAGWLVEDYSMVSQSISALAAGERSWMQDYGLYGLAVGIAALALGLWVRRSPDRSGMIGIAALSLIALDIGVIAFFHGYAKKDVSGMHLHTYAVFALGLLFAVSSFLMGLSLRRSEQGYAVFSFVICVSWILSAPFFFSVPSNWFGLYERGVGLLLLAWVCAMGWLIFIRTWEVRRV